MTIFTRRLLAVGLVVAAPVVTALTFLGTRSDLPDPLPIHWNLRGVVDNTASVTSVAWMALTIISTVAIAAVIVIYLATPPVASRFTGALLTFLAWTFGAVAILTFLLSAGQPEASAVHLPGWALPVMVGAAAALAYGSWAVLPGGGPRSADLPVTSSLQLRPGEAVTWVDGMAAPWARWMAAGAAAVAVVVLFIEPLYAIPAVVVMVAAVMMSEIAVRIDDAGLHTLWGPVGWPRTTVPLAKIETVRAELIEPTEWGGWGYRMSRRGVAVVLRRGPGIIVSRRGRSDFAVTVPHAEQGVDVLRALIARAHGKV